MKTNPLLVLLFTSCVCHGEWILWEPEAGKVFPASRNRLVLPVPADVQAGGLFEFALRTVDVFGNVSEFSETLGVRVPGELRARGSRIPVETVRAPTLTGNQDRMIPVPSGLRARILPGERLLELEWRVQQDIETLGVQVLRRPPAVPSPDGQSLVFWRFPEKPPTEDGVPERLHLPERLHPKLQSAELRIAEGFLLEDNVFRNAYGVRFAGERWGDVADRPDRHVSIQLVPKPGQTVSLHHFMVGLWSMDGGRTLEHRLTYSLDGFRTHAEIPLVPESPLVETGRRLGGGVPVRADLRSQRELQNFRQAVEFRLYLWGTNERGIGKIGVESTRENLPDIQFFGE